jgi:response regulator RpfG family c-di-GMP phosphodiesterase
MVMKPPVVSYLAYVLREFLFPVNYAAALFIGAVINLLQSGSPLSSAVPYLVPVAVQAVSKGTVKFRARKTELLVRLPRERKDPAFVMDGDGNILAATGNTENLFRRLRVANMTDLVCSDHFTEVILGVEEGGGSYGHECYSPPMQKWYDITVKRPRDRMEYLVWFDDVTVRKRMDLRMQSLRGFSNEILNSVDESIDAGDNFERLARLILGNGFSAVFITEEDDEGNHGGSVYLIADGELRRSPRIDIDAMSAAPILISRRTYRLFSSSREEIGSQEDFELTFPFDPRVRHFIGTPLTNFINYHEGKISLIAFNKSPHIGEDDFLFIETAVNTARSVRSLMSLARDNDQKFVQGIMGLCAASEFSDEITGRHIFRVNLYSGLLAENAGMAAKGVRTISQVAAIHDIGKVAIPHIIKLPRKLTPEERERMEMHPVYGAKILEQMMAYEDRVDPRLKMAYQIALHHHQTWAGTGYPRILAPDGGIRLTTDPEAPEYRENRPLRGEEIPQVALMVSLADKYDALRARRQYKEGFSHRKTLEILTQDDLTGISGEEQFGPQLFSLFMDLNREFERIFEDNRDSV